MPFLVAGLLTGCGGTRSSGLIPIGAGLRGPDGWRASVFATGLKHASAFAFDGEGRLWVTTSAAADHRSDGVYVVARAARVPSGSRAWTDRWA